MKIFHDYLIFHISTLWTKCFYQLGKYFVIKINLVPLTSLSFKLKLMSHSDFKMKWINERNIESHFSLKPSFRPYLCYLEQFVKECSPSSCSQISWWYTMNGCSNIKEFWFYLQTKETRIFRHFVLFCSSFRDENFCSYSIADQIFIIFMMKFVK